MPPLPDELRGGNLAPRRPGEMNGDYILNELCAVLGVCQGPVTRWCSSGPQMLREMLHRKGKLSPQRVLGSLEESRAPGCSHTYLLLGNPHVVSNF